MLRRLRRSPRRWGAVLGGALILSLLVVSVAMAIAITVDGDCSEWTPNTYEDSDVAEASVPDKYDIVPVYSTTDLADGEFCVRFNTESDLYLNGGSYLEIHFDMDDSAATGQSQDCQAGFGTIGSDSYVYALLGNLPGCGTYRWNSGTSSWDFQSSNCSARPYGEGQKSDTCVEICANAEDLLIGGDPPPTVKVFFENGDGSEPPPPDDIFCFNTHHTTAVELSSFTACSEPEQPSDPELTSVWLVALLSGVVAVSAGGFVLWSRKGLTRQ